MKKAYKVKYDRCKDSNVSELNLCKETIECSHFRVVYIKRSNLLLRPTLIYGQEQNQVQDNGYLQPNQIV